MTAPAPHSVRASQARRLAAAPRCPHGRLLSGAGAGGAYIHRECRLCVSATITVAAFVEAHPGGADLRDCAEALGVTYQAVQQAEARALGKLTVWLAGEAEGPPTHLGGPDGSEAGGGLGDAGEGRQ